MRSQFAAVLEVVSPLRQDVSEIKETLAAHDARFDKIEGQISGLTAASREHSADLRELKSDVKEIKQFVGSHEERLVALESTTA